MKNIRERLNQTSITAMITYGLFVVAVVFADIMYLQLVTKVVDSDLLILAIAGAFALGGSVLILPAKLRNGDIKPGHQRTVAIAVLLIEFLVMAANVVVAFAEAGGDIPDGLLGVYATYVAPITPIIAALGILLIWLADPIDQAKQTQYEVETAKAIAELELKGQLAETAITAMQEFLSSDEAHVIMKNAARDHGYRLLRDVLAITNATAVAPLQLATTTTTIEAPTQPVTTNAEPVPVSLPLSNEPLPLSEPSRWSDDEPLIPNA